MVGPVDVDTLIKQPVDGLLGVSITPGIVSATQHVPSPGMSFNIMAKLYEEFDQLNRFSHGPRSSAGSRVSAVLEQQLHQREILRRLLQAGSRVRGSD